MCSESGSLRPSLNGILLDDFSAFRNPIRTGTAQGQGNRSASWRLKTFEAQTPFHWGYEFDEIIDTRGGFDVIITNPPWEIFKPIDREFAKRHDRNIDRRLSTKAEFKAKLNKMIENPKTQAEYLGYLSAFPHVSAYYRSTSQYKNQISRVNGRKQGTDINLYKLFTEQCYNLLRDGGTCGIVIPSGIYSDLGTKQLRQMLFEGTQVTGLFGFENKKAIFEGVHKSFKFVVLTFEKGEQTESFPAAFMHHDVKELEHFPNDDSVKIDISLVERLSPTSLSVTEFKNAFDVQIAKKMLQFPSVGEELHNTWNVKLHRELDMTNDAHLFHTEPADERLPLYEGKMIWHFTAGYATTRYWVDAEEGRERVLGTRKTDTGQVLDYQYYRFGCRSITGATNERTMVCSIVPRNVFCGNSLLVSKRSDKLITDAQLLAFTALMSSFVVDFSLRQAVATQMNMFYIYQTPVPRLTQGDPFFDSIVRRATQLICTTPEFDDLAAEVGLVSHLKGVTDPAGRAKLRAELDGIIAHIYGLTENEFAYVLSTFPLVAEPVKVAALNAYRDVERGVVQ